MHKGLKGSALSHLSRRRRLLLGLITLAIGTGIGLLVMELALDYQRRYIEQSDKLDEGMVMYDPDHGWRMRPDWTGSHHHYDFAASYHINRYGFRGSYAEPRGGIRVALVGDSFTFGQGVDGEQTFSHLLGEATAGRSAFLNFGVLGFSTDQQYLLIKDRVGLFNPDLVLLVVYLGNDLFDNERPYPLQGEHGKPYFQLIDGELELRNSPVARKRKPAAARRASLSSVVLGEETGQPAVWHASLGRLEIFRRIGVFQAQGKIPDSAFAPRFENALELFFALIEKTDAEVERQGAVLKLVLLPGRSYVAQADSVSAQYQDYLRRRIVGGLGDVPVFDLATAMRAKRVEAGGQWYFPNEGHLSPLGHRVVADLLGEWLGLGE